MSELTSAKVPVTFTWLEITPSCQLKCQHCYVSSQPGLGHGAIRFGHWKEIMLSLQSMGVRMIQFIGGEPTIHPKFCELVEFAASLGFEIEVYSNLAGISARMWDIFTHHNIRLATSFYTIHEDVHEAITQTPGSFQKTLANIKKALSLELRLRIGMIEVLEGQDIQATKTMLEEMGIIHIGIDRTRGVGRGSAVTKTLCRHFAERVLVVSAPYIPYCIFIVFILYLT